MKIVGLLVLAALCMWMQPWSASSARAARAEVVQRAESGSRCPVGHRKSTVTAKCVRSGLRLPSLF